MATLVVFSERIMVYWDVFDLLFHWIYGRPLGAVAYHPCALSSWRLGAGMLICIWVNSRKPSA